MDDLAEDLQRFLRHKPVMARPASAARRLRLWIKRKPAMAALSFAAVSCASAFAAALVAGYWRTAFALTLAERNAAVVDEALSRIFAHIENPPPSRNGTELLSTLLPYYLGIAAQRGLPRDKIAEANRVIGTAAFRAGNYPLAEKSLCAAV